MRRETPIWSLAALMALFGWVILLSRCHGGEKRVKTLEWNPSPGATSYEVFLGITRIATTTENRVRAYLPYGMCSVAVRALNEHGASAFSEPLVIPAVHFELNQVIEFSPDLVTWDTQFTPQKRFARIRTTYKP